MTLHSFFFFLLPLPLQKNKHFSHRTRWTSQSELRLLHLLANCFATKKYNFHQNSDAGRLSFWALWWKLKYIYVHLREIRASGFKCSSKVGFKLPMFSCVTESGPLLVLPSNIDIIRYFVFITPGHTCMLPTQNTESLVCSAKLRIS